MAGCGRERSGAGRGGGQLGGGGREFNAAGVCLAGVACAHDLRPNALPCLHPSRLTQCSGDASGVYAMIKYQSGQSWGVEYFNNVRGSACA